MDGEDNGKPEPFLMEYLGVSLFSDVIHFTWDSSGQSNIIPQPN